MINHDISKIFTFVTDLNLAPIIYVAPEHLVITTETTQNTYSSRKFISNLRLPIQSQQGDIT